jgi:hypothetical protein
MLDIEALLLLYLPSTAKEARETGANHYFTGKSCKHGHISKRFTSGECFECQAEKALVWREKNKERYEERQKEWRNDNPDKVKKYNQKAWDKNGEKNREKNKERYKGYTKEQKAEWGRNYRRKNKEKLKIKNKEYNTKLRLDAINGYGGKCARCGYDDDWRALCIDHVDGNGKYDRQVAKKGKVFFVWLRDNNYPEGYQVLCANCNLIKAIENKEIGGNNKKC